MLGVLSVCHEDLQCVLDEVHSSVDECAVTMFSLCEKLSSTVELLGFLLLYVWHYNTPVKIISITVFLTILEENENIAWSRNIATCLHLSMVINYEGLNLGVITVCSFVMTRVKKKRAIYLRIL